MTSDTQDLQRGAGSRCLFRSALVQRSFQSAQSGARNDLADSERREMGRMQFRFLRLQREEVEDTICCLSEREGAVLEKVVLKEMATKKLEFCVGG